MGSSNIWAGMLAMTAAAFARGRAERLRNNSRSPTSSSSWATTSATGTSAPITAA